MNDNLTYLRNFYHLEESKEKYLYDYINKNLKNYSMSNQYERFLIYWRENIQEIQRLRPESVKSEYRYDFKSILTRFFNDGFFFKR